MRAVFSDQFEPELLADFFAKTPKGVYLDVGGNRPDNSVSGKFHELGWTGLVIEPIPENAELFRKAGRENIWQGAVTSPSKSKEGTATFYLAGGENNPLSSLKFDGISPRERTTKTISVKLSTVDEVMKKHDFSHIDLLSIDTEGTEVDVLKGINLPAWNVKLLLVEDWARDFSIHCYLKKQGYRLVRRTGFNSWYVPESTNFPLSFIGRLQLFRKIVLGMPFRRLRHWRHERKLLS